VLVLGGSLYPRRSGGPREIPASYQYYVAATAAPGHCSVLRSPSTLGAADGASWVGGIEDGCPHRCVVTRLLGQHGVTLPSAAQEIRLVPSPTLGRVKEDARDVSRVGEILLMTF
jgi:hypothetical protein